MKWMILLSTVVGMASCTTLENRRDLYSPQTVEGPYTRMIQDGIPAPGNEPDSENSYPDGEDGRTWSK